MAYSLSSLDELPTEMPPVGTAATLHVSTAETERAAEAIAQTGRNIASAFETGSKTLAGYLEQQAQIENKTRASDATRQGRIGLSGLSADLLSKQGADALEAWKTYPQRQQEIIDSTIGTGTNPYQKLLIREQMNNHADALMDIGARHTAQQEKQYQKTTAAANENEHGNTALSMAMQGNLPEAYRNLDLAQDEAKNHIHLDLGIPPGKQLDELGKERLGPHVANVVEGIYLRGGPDALKNADDFYESMRGKIDEKSASIINRWLKGAHADSEADQAFQELKANAGTRMRGLGAGIGGVNAGFERAFREKFGVRPPGAGALLTPDEKNDTAAAIRRAGDVGGMPARAADNAMSLLGAHERGPGRLAIIDYLRTGGQHLDPATTAWCAAYVNASLNQAGLRGLSGPNQLVASQFETWGVPVGRTDVQKGDVIVETRGRAPGETGGHVGLATGVKRGASIEMISGNKHDSVAKSWVLATDLSIQFRRAGPSQMPSGSGSSAGILDQARAAIAKNPGAADAVKERLRTTYGIDPEGL